MILLLMFHDASGHFPFEKGGKRSDIGDGG
jgi:hypothetical protein